MIPLSDIEKAYYGALESLITLPVGWTAFKYTPKIGKVILNAIKQTVKNPKPVLYDIGTWAALNEGTKLVTDKTADQWLNWKMGFPEDNGPAPFITGAASGISRRLISKVGKLVAKAISPKYAFEQSLKDAVNNTNLKNSTTFFDDYPKQITMNQEIDEDAIDRLLRRYLTKDH